MVERYRAAKPAEDPELTTLARKINEAHAAAEAEFKASLLRHRTGMAYALQCGDLLNEVKAKVPHGNKAEPGAGWEAWVETNCKFGDGSPVSTAQLYSRIARRIAEMPELKPEALGMSLNRADRFLADEHKRRLRRKQLDDNALDAAMDEFWDGLGQAMHRRQFRVGAEWETFVGTLPEPIRTVVSYMAGNPPLPDALKMPPPADDDTDLQPGGNAQHVVHFTDR